MTMPFIATGTVALGGIGVVYRLRRTVPGAPLLMLTLGLCGMGVGLFVDVPLPLLGTDFVSLCTPRLSGMLAAALHHAAAMPATFSFMVLGSVVAMLLAEIHAAANFRVRRLYSSCAFDIACNLAMPAGMICSWEIVQQTSWQWDPPAVIVAMAGGMAWAMAAVALIWQACAQSWVPLPVARGLMRRSKPIPSDMDP